MNAMLKKHIASFYIALLLSVDPIQAYRRSVLASRLSNSDEPVRSKGVEEIQELAARIETSMLAGDSSLDSPLNQLELAMQLYRSSEEDKDSQVLAIDHPVVVALRTALFKGLANQTGKPGAIQMQELMQWLHANDDITIVTQLALKLLLGQDPSGQQQLSDEMAARVEKAQTEGSAEPSLEDFAANNLLEQEQENELGRAIEQTREQGETLMGVINEMSTLVEVDNQTNHSFAQLNQLVAKVKGLGWNSSSLVQVGGPEGEQLSVLKGLKTFGGFFVALGRAAWNIIIVVLAFTLGAVCCFIGPALGYLISAVIGLAWCFVGKLIWKLLKMGMNTIHQKVNKGEAAQEGFFSWTPDVTGNFKECMAPVWKAADWFGGTWDRNAGCFKQALTGTLL